MTKLEPFVAFIIYLLLFQNLQDVQGTRQSLSTIPDMVYGQPSRLLTDRWYFLISGQLWEQTPVPSWISEVWPKWTTICFVNYGSVYILVFNLTLEKSEYIQTDNLKKK